MTLYTTNMQILHGSWLKIIHSAFCKNVLMYIGMRTHMYMYIQDYAHVHLPAHLHTLTHTSKTLPAKKHVRINQRLHTKWSMHGEFSFNPYLSSWPFYRVCMVALWRYMVVNHMEVPYMHAC